MGIQFEGVAYAYPGGSRKRIPALQSLDLRWEEGRFITVFGAPGSGKSTLLQLMNGILQPTDGELRILDYVLRPGEKLQRTNELRKRVGLVFQFPERQLFEATIEEDLIFGPLHFGATKEEAKATARRVCEQLHLDAALLRESPFRVSGGQMRKAAIGAVLAADPDVLALDEPTASLDPAGREELLRLLRRLCDEEGKTIVLVTHRLEEALPFTDRFVAMREGRAIFHGDATELLQAADELEEAGLALPPSLHMLRRFAAHYGAELPASAAFSAEGMAEYMSGILKGRDAACAVR